MKTNTFQKEYQKKLKGDSFCLYPSMKGVTLQLEITNICNHKCIFCPNSQSSRTKKIINKEFAKRIIKECAELGVKRICYHMNGETLVVPFLDELISYSKQQGYTYTFITTNGSLATESTLKKIFDAGLDSIKFSINATNKNNYIEIHGKDHFDQVMKALKFSYSYRKEKKRNYKILTSVVVTKKSGDNLKEFYDLLKKYNDEVLFYHLASYAGQMTHIMQDLYRDINDLGLPVIDIVHDVPCTVLMNSINVTCEGYLAICCSEADNLMAIEDLNKISVYDAWYGEAMTKVREQHIEGNISELPCVSCITGKQTQVKPVNKKLYESNKNQKYRK